VRTPVLVLTAVLCATFAALSVPKLTGQRRMLERMAHLGVSARLTRVVGVLEGAAVVGLLAGLVVPAVAVLAAVGLVCHMAGAVVYHTRAGDPPGVRFTPLVFAAAAAVLAVLHVLA
jgi:hypothetical protein